MESFEAFERAMTHGFGIQGVGLFGFGLLALVGLFAPIAAAWFVGERLRDRDWPRWVCFPIALAVLLFGYVMFLPAVTALDQAKCWRSGLNGEELQVCLEGGDQDADRD